MGKTKISIVLSIYNGEKYIIEQLESIMNQTRVSDEVLITDDGSTDNTVNLVRFFVDNNKLKNWKIFIKQFNKKGE